MENFIKKLLRESLINEGVSDITYHFTNTYKLDEILKTNKINLSAAFGSPSDNEINKNKLFFLSTTSSRNSDIGYAASLPKDNIVRITLNGRLLNQNNKSTRVDYWQRPKDPRNKLYNPNDVPTTGKDFYKKVSRQDELEDRFISDKNEIKPANKYIISIEIFSDNNMGKLKYLSDNLNIPFFVYDNINYFNGSVKNKAIEVASDSIPNDVEKRRGYLDTNIIAYLVFRDDKLRAKIFNDIQAFDIDIDWVKNKVDDRINDKLNYYLRNGSEFYINDFASSMSADVHNMRSSSNEFDRYLIKELGMDMKRNNVNSIKGYLNYKVWKGKKTQNDYNKELNQKFMNFIDDNFKEQISNYTNYSFDADGVEYENILDYKPIMDLFNNFLIKLKKYVSDYMLTNDDMYRLKYVLDSSHIKETVNISKPEINSILDNIDFYGSKFTADDVKAILYYIVSDFSNYAYDELEQAKKEFNEQFT
jgi:hypothetical protein